MGVPLGTLVTTVAPMPLVTVRHGTPLIVEDVDCNDRSSQADDSEYDRKHGFLRRLRCSLLEHSTIQRRGRKANNYFGIAGCWLLAAGCWLLAAGCWLLAAGTI